jgi:hypothetical protein
VIVKNFLSKFILPIVVAFALAISVLLPIDGKIFKAEAQSASSTIVIYTTGKPVGLIDPSLRLIVDDKIVHTFDLLSHDSSVNSLTYNSSLKLNENQIKLQTDSSMIKIDYISIDGVNFQPHYQNSYYTF